VAAIDECQELFSHAEFGKEAGELAEKVIKLGRALGIELLLATQRPDAKSVPTGVSANVGTRYCLRVMGQMENDMILGTSAYKNGIRATMFVRKDKGVGYLVGAADEAQIVRGYYVNAQNAEQIVARARTAREAAGTLTGHAAGQPTDTPASRRDTLLDDILAVALGQLAAGGALTDEQVTAVLLPVAADIGQAPGEARRTIASGLRAGAGRPRTVAVEGRAA
jgi:S-DNA-T family DNA segregation ATPase FtsK/SpoIIIE